MSERSGRAYQPAAVPLEICQARVAWAGTREQLYQSFANVPRPSRMTGCPHCVPKDADLPLLAHPVSQLDPAALAPYSSKAITTWGSAQHLRYFAPRLVECVITGAAEFPTAEVVLGKLACAGWLDWPVEQVDAIRRCLLAWWQLTLAGDGPDDADTVLCAIAATGTTLAPYLAQWSRFSTPASTILLQDLVTMAVQWGPRQRLRNTFWRDHPQAQQQLLHWLTQGDAARALATAFERAADDALLERISTLHTWLAPPVTQTQPARPPPPSPVSLARCSR